MYVYVDCLATIKALNSNLVELKSAYNSLQVLQLLYIPTMKKPMNVHQSDCPSETMAYID